MSESVRGIRNFFSGGACLGGLANSFKSRKVLLESEI